MAEEKKFYWLKLKRNFFKRHDIRIIEEMENGKDYILFYLKMLLESIDHEGELRFSETIPYDEKMLSVITNTNIDIVRSAMKVFVGLNMIEILDDNTIYMAEVLKLTGSETATAERMRKSRKKKKELAECNIVTNECNDVQKRDTEKEIEKELELKTNNIYKNIIDYLNEQIGTHYRPTNKTTQKHINARLTDGYTLEDFKIVIDKMCAKWKGTDMEQYLRPETLFGTKFESYLNAKINTKEVKSGGRTEKFDAESKFDEFFNEDSYI